MLVKNQLTIRYAFIQAFYFVAFSCIFAFAAVYLRDCGFDSQQVGITLALGYLTAMLVQPTVAAYADRSRTIRLNQFCALLAAALLLSVVLLVLLPKNLPVVMLFFVLAEMLILVLQPFINSLSLNYINQGIPINFGLARGLGSGAFALTSLALGAVIYTQGSSILIVICAITSLLLTVFILTFKMPPAVKATEFPQGGQQAKKATLSGNPLGVISKYPGFMIMLAGLVLLMTNQHLFSNYQILFVERIGGTSKILGIAMFMAAMMEIPVMGFFSLFVRKITARKLLRVSAVFFVVKALATLLAATVGQFLLSQVFQAGAYALYLPASVFYVNSIMEREDVVKGQAFLGVVFTMGGIFGSLLGGVLLDFSSVPATLITSLGITAVGALLLFRGTRVMSSVR